MKYKSFVPERPYLLRYLAFALATRAKQSVFDYSHFPTYKLSGTGKPTIPKVFDSRFGDLRLTSQGDSITLSNLLEQSDTLSFLIVKDGRIAYQYYADGMQEDTPALAYSVTKSFFSTYLAHLQDGGVLSFADRLGQYHSHLPDFLGKRTIQSLMNMEAGIRYTHGKYPHTDMARFWLSPNIGRALTSVRKSPIGSSRFLYNDIHLHLLYRLVSQRISDVPTDFKQSVWNALGMSYDGFFAMDSSASGRLKIDGGLAITAQDLAKFGMLYLNDGKVDGRQVVPAAWCHAIKSSEGVRRDLEFWELYQQMNHRWYPILKRGKTYYKNFWWGIERENGPNDIYAMGILGQFVYVSTRSNMVIVRQGNSWGTEGWWPTYFEEIASKASF